MTTLAEDITTMRSYAHDMRALYEVSSSEEEEAALERFLVILTPLASLSLEQVELMLVQTKNLATSWAWGAEGAWSDGQHDRCKMLAGGYEAIAKALEALRG